MGSQVRAVIMLFCVLGCCPAQEGTRKIVSRVNPVYPSVARTMRLQGIVRVEAVIAADGSVKTMEVKGGHPVLVEAAHAAIMEWKWVPAAKESHELIEIKFNP